MFIKSLEDFIGAHTIPVNKYNLIDLADRIESTLYPLGNKFSTTLLRQYGISIATLSTNISNHIKLSSQQIEYTNALTKYMIITTVGNIAMMQLTNPLIAAAIIYMDNFIASIVAEVVLNIIVSFMTSMIVEMIAESSAGMQPNNSSQMEAGMTGALGTLLGFPIFALHGNIISGLSKFTISISNILASVETSLATSAVVSKMYNQEFNIKDAAIAGVGMGAFSVLHSGVTHIYDYMRSIRGHNTENIELGNINTPTISKKNIINDVNSPIFDQVHIQNNKNIYIGDINNNHYILSNKLPVLDNIRFISMSHEVNYMGEFINHYVVQNNGEIHVFHSCDSDQFAGQLKGKEINRFITSVGDVAQTGRHIKGDFYYYERILDSNEDATYNRLPLGSSLIKGLSSMHNMDTQIDRNMSKQFKEAYKDKLYYREIKWGELGDKIVLDMSGGIFVNNNVKDTVLHKEIINGETYYVNKETKSRYTVDDINEIKTIYPIKDNLYFKKVHFDENNIIPTQREAKNAKEEFKDLKTNIEYQDIINSRKEYSTEELVISSSANIKVNKGKNTIISTSIEDDDNNYNLLYTQDKINIPTYQYKEDKNIARGGYINNSGESSNSSRNSNNNSNIINQKNKLDFILNDNNDSIYPSNIKRSNPFDINDQNKKVKNIDNNEIQINTYDTIAEQIRSAVKVIISERQDSSIEDINIEDIDSLLNINNIKLSRKQISSSLNKLKNEEFDRKYQVIESLNNNIDRNILNNNHAEELSSLHTLTDKITYATKVVLLRKIENLTNNNSASHIFLINSETGDQIMSFLSQYGIQLKTKQVTTALTRFKKENILQEIIRKN